MLCSYPLSLCSLKLLYPMLQEIKFLLQILRFILLKKRNLKYKVFFVCATVNRAILLSPHVNLISTEAGCGRYGSRSSERISMKFCWSLYINNRCNRMHFNVCIRCISASLDAVTGVVINFSCTKSKIT